VGWGGGGLLWVGELTTCPQLPVFQNTKTKSFQVKSLYLEPVVSEPVVSF